MPYYVPPTRTDYSVETKDIVGKDNKFLEPKDVFNLNKSPEEEKIHYETSRYLKR